MLAVLLINAIVCAGAFYCVKNEPRLVKQLSKAFIALVNGHKIDRANSILKLAKTSPAEAFELAIKLEEELLDTKFHDHLWATRRNNWMFLVDFLIAEKAYGDAATYLDRWHAIHHRDLDLLDYEAVVFAEISNRKKDHLHVLKERARRFPQNSLANDEYIKHLISIKRFDEASRILVRHLLNVKTQHELPWTIYVKGQKGFSSNPSTAAYFESLGGNHYISTVKIESDVKVVRFDPSAPFSVLKNVRIDILSSNGSSLDVWETLSLSPEFSPRLHQIKYDALNRTYVLTDTQDPRFVLTLRKPVPEGAKLRIHVETGDKRGGSRRWVRDALLEIPLPIMTETLTNLHWEFIQEAEAREVRNFIEAGYATDKFSNLENMKGQERITELVIVGRHDVAISELIEYFNYRIGVFDGDWRLYVHGKSRFSEDTSSGIKFAINSKSEFTGGAKISEDITRIRLDPPTSSFELAEVLIEIVLDEEVIETLELSPKFSPKLHSIRYQSNVERYIANGDADPFFILDLENPIPKDAQLRVRVSLANLIAWTKELLATIPLADVEKGTSQLLFEGASSGASELRRLFEDRINAAP